MIHLFVSPGHNPPLPLWIERKKLPFFCSVGFGSNGDGEYEQELFRVHIL